MRVGSGAWWWLFSFFILISYQNCSMVDSGFQPSESLRNSSWGESSRVSPTPIPRDESELKEFFKNTVEVAFESQCMSCHNEPRFGGTAPLSIYDYDSMKSKLSDGVSAANNVLINKIRNVISHEGGDRCASGGSWGSPCKEVIQWWEEEFGESDSSSGSSKVTSITDLGRVVGYASDSNNGARVLNVTFYLDGPAGSGVLLGTVQANQQGPIGDPFEGHYFDFTLPDEYRDGTERTLYVYADGTNAVNQVGVAQVFTAYRLGVEGEDGYDYYMNTVRPLLNQSCSGCHDVFYSAQFTVLLSPSPAQGGTSTVNKLIDKAAGLDSHGGGNRCGSKNQSPCAELITWWNLEFN